MSREDFRQRGSRVIPTRALIAGEVETDLHWDDVVNKNRIELEEECARLRAENGELRRHIAEARGIIEGATQARRALAPLYEGMRRFFGDLDAFQDSPSAPPQQNDRVDRIWEGWKQRMGPECAKVIDALRERPGMNTTQVAIATGKSRNAIPGLIYKLNQAGLISKNGNCFTLKEL